MTNVIGISFYDSNKIYYFLPNNLDLNRDDKVIVETERGQQYAYIKTGIISVDEKKLVSPLKPILRKANDIDEKQNSKNLVDAKNAVQNANIFVKELELDMKILNANFTFDRKQLLFNFLADDRIDFRVLAKKLAAIYKTRIELRQIGVRDKAREVGGYGQCGKKLCCSTFLKDMTSVSINMAKNQNLALNPEKINGCCGRLMCCLSYENDNYQEYRKGMPKMYDKVKTKEGEGKVIYIDLFEKMYKIETPDGTIKEIKL